MATQRPTGEIPSFASALGDGEPTWEPDSLKFITALVALALREVEDPRAQELADRATSFLRSEVEGPDLWRYWSREHERHGFTPPDADDTACASMALNAAGSATGRNRAVLLANRDAQGRFYTWLVPHRPWPRDPRAWWALRGELRARTSRHELWESTEATYDDVDGVVNANVVRYLGPDAPEPAVTYVAGIVEAEGEADCDSWHRSPFNLYASMAAGLRRGVTAFAPLATEIGTRIAARQRPDGTVGHPLDTALAANALVDLDLGPETLDGLRTALEATQRDDGSWPRDVYYYGGPTEVFGWASEALATAYAVRALAGGAPGRPGPTR